VPLEYYRQVELFVRGNLSPEASALKFADRVRAELADMISRHDVPARYETFVDGRKGADERTVKAGGTIAYSFDYTPDIVAFVLAFLYARAPTQTERGRGGPGPKSEKYPAPFRESFYVSIDGRFFKPGAVRPADLTQGARELIFGNMQPFNRKATVQMIGNRRIHFNAPDFQYDDAARAVRARFGNLVTAEPVQNLDFPGKAGIKRTQYDSRAKHIVRRLRGSDVESPGLIIRHR
jgi:hypothetical protein